MSQEENKIEEVVVETTPEVNTEVVTPKAETNEVETIAKPVVDNSKIEALTAELAKEKAKSEEIKTKRDAIKAENKELKQEVSKFDIILDKLNKAEAQAEIEKDTNALITKYGDNAKDFLSTKTLNPNLTDEQVETLIGHVAKTETVEEAEEVKTNQGIVVSGAIKGKPETKKVGMSEAQKSLRDF